MRKVLEQTRKFGLKMNPKKCAFGVSASQFLGFLVHERGIEIGLKSQEAACTDTRIFQETDWKLGVDCGCDALVLQ